MTFRGLLPYVALGVFGLFAVVLVGMYLVPALRDGRDAVHESRRRTAEIATRETEICGAAYEDGLKTARDRGDAFLKDALGALRTQRDNLAKWFPRLDVTDAKGPDREKFVSMYKFEGDELTRRIVTTIRQRTGREIATVPQYKPRFIEGQRMPVDLDEMRNEQRHFNLQKTLLVAAAGAGAVTIEPPDMADDWPATDRERRFLETKVTLKLEIEDKRVPQLVRNLISLEGDGPIVRITALATGPRPLPPLLGPNETPLIEAEVRLGVHELSQE